MIYVVSGFFRSGTSLVMQACEAGGLPVHRNAQRDELNERHADEPLALPSGYAGMLVSITTYRPNPVSLYEPSAGELRVIGFPRAYDGKAVKILVGWPMATHEYRVVVMRRDPEEIMESSARAFGEHLDKPSRDRWIAEYPARFGEHVRALGNRRDVRAVLVFDFVDLFANARAVFTELRADGWPLDVGAAVSVVRPSLRRVGVGAAQ